MIVYIAAFTLSMICGYFAERLKNSPRPKSWLKRFGFALLVLLCFSAVCLPAAVRKNVGTDYWNTYVPMLNAMRTSGHVPNTDLVVKFFFWLVYTLKLSNQWFFILTSIYINAFVIAAIFVSKKGNVIISLGVYFLNCIYFASLSNIRQLMGAATILLAFSLIANAKAPKNIVWGLILAVISGLCHPSCWLSSVVFVFCLLPLKVKVMMPLTLVGLILSPALSAVAIQLIKLTKYAYFFASYNDYSALGALGLIAPDVILLVLTLLVMAKKKEHTKVLIPFMLMKACAIFFFVLTLFRSIELFIRLHHIFFALDLVYAPLLMNAYMNKEARIVIKGGGKADKSLVYAQVATFVAQDRARANGSAISWSATRTLASDMAIILSFLIYAFSFFVQEIHNSYFEVLPYHSIWG